MFHGVPLMFMILASDLNALFHLWFHQREEQEAKLWWVFFFITATRWRGKYKETNKKSNKSSRKMPF